MAITHVLATLLQRGEQPEAVGGVLERGSLGQVVDRGVGGIPGAHGERGIRRR